MCMLPLSGIVVGVVVDDDGECCTDGGVVGCCVGVGGGCGDYRI